MSAPATQPKPTGLAQTFALLAETRNEAALDVLLPALDSPVVLIQEASLQALLARRNPVAQRAVLSRLHRDTERWKAIIGDGRGQLTHALREGVLGSDPQLCANACQAILWFREYDLMQSLVTAAEDDTHENHLLAAQTLLSLADLLYEQLSGPRDYADRRDPQLVRAHVVSTLEASVKRFSRHNRKEVMTAFLILAGRDNAVLKQILLDPLHQTYLAMVDVLLHSERMGVLRLLLSFLDDPHAPSTAMGILARRSDPQFVKYLLRKVGYEPSAVAALNLKRVDNIPWLRGKLELFDHLDDAAQHAAVKMLMASSVKRGEAFKVIEHVLAQGKPGGRRMAAEALGEFHGAEANALALRALEDEDPRVQAIVVSQLRARGIPGALSKLIEFVESRHEIVRQAACDSLSEFDFDRFMASFEMLDEDVRRTTGVLVRKINPHAVANLRQELRNQSRTKRLRALAAAAAMDAIGPLESAIIEVLSDEDHLVRAEAARALAMCNSPAVVQALRGALHDRAVVVQETAQRSLQEISRRGHWIGEPEATSKGVLR
jgi:HEAT repeat protein